MTFQRFAKLVDVGGAHGAMTLAIAKRYPSIRYTCFDLPTAELGAIRTFRDRGLEDRCDFVGGDFFDDDPAGADAYLLSAVLHDWGDERCLQILRNCRRHTADTGRVLVVDIVEVSLDRIHQQLLFRSALFMQGGSRLLGVKLPENAQTTEVANRRCSADSAGALPTKKRISRLITPAPS